MNVIDPQLQSTARFLPRGFLLKYGYRPQRAVMNILGAVGALREVADVPISPDVTVRVHRPSPSTASAAEPGPALLWMHGGGCALGTAKQDDAFCRKLACLTGVSVVAVNYRLVPEHPYPTPIEDCYTALLWLARQSWVDPTRIAIGGASAGGHYAATLAFTARDRGEVKPVLQMLVHPQLDDRTLPGNQRWIMWSAEDNRRAWNWYLGDADRAVAVPARRTDLEGLPPAWIGVGTEDPFLDEAVSYGERLNAANVPAHVHIARGAFHTFDVLVPNAPISLAFLASQCEHLRAAMNCGQPA